MKTTAPKQCYHTSAWDRATSLTHPTTMRHFARLNFTYYVVFFSRAVNCILFFIAFFEGFFRHFPAGHIFKLPFIFANRDSVIFECDHTKKNNLKCATLQSCRHSPSCKGALPRATVPGSNLIQQSHKTFFTVPPRTRHRVASFRTAHTHNLTESEAKT